MNYQAMRAIYIFEMSRFFRTYRQSFLAPVISTSLYFIVFGAAIGSRIDQVEGVSYGAFIVPGLIMLSVMTQATSNASFGIYFPKFTGSIYELLSAPINFLEATVGYATDDDPNADGFFRIGHMGHVNAQMIMGTLGAIQSGLMATKIPYGAGGLEAAAHVLAAATHG